MHAFVTVGSTRFDTLVQAVFTEDVLSSLCRKGYTRLVVQCGNSTFELASTIKNGNTHKMNRAGVDIEFWSYKPSLQEDYEKADLVISHAGRLLLFVWMSICFLSYRFWNHPRRSAHGKANDCHTQSYAPSQSPGRTCFSTRRIGASESYHCVVSLRRSDLVLEFNHKVLRNLSRTIEEFDALNIEPFPPFDGSRFARIVDEAMGFI